MELLFIVNVKQWQNNAKHINFLNNLLQIRKIGAKKLKRDDYFNYLEEVQIINSILLGSI